MDNGGNYNQAFQTYMNDIVTAIQNTAPTTSSGFRHLGYEYTLSQFASYPISGSNIGYAGHWYPYGDTVMSDFTTAFNNTWKP